MYAIHVYVCIIIIIYYVCMLSVLMYPKLILIFNFSFVHVSTIFNLCVCSATLTDLLRERKATDLTINLFSESPSLSLSQ